MCFYPRRRVDDTDRYFFIVPLGFLSFSPLAFSRMGSRNRDGPPILPARQEPKIAKKRVWCAAIHAPEMRRNFPSAVDNHRARKEASIDAGHLSHISQVLRGQTSSKSGDDRCLLCSVRGLVRVQLVNCAHSLPWVREASE